MNCTRVLNVLSNPKAAGIPVDLAMCLTLSQRQPLYQLLSMSPLKPTQRLCQSADYSQQAGLHSPHLSSVPPASHLSCHVPSGLRSCLRRYSNGVSKKRVVFADTKGLALTAVRLFVSDSPCPTSTLTTRASPVKSTSNRLQTHRLRLGFSQPTMDFKAFLSRLQENHVQLESCSVSDNSFSGKVYTSHGSTERAAHVRVTFDSWRTHLDVPCTFLHQQYCGTSDVDVFTFDISLPQNVDPKEQIEFCVSFRPGSGSMVHWDDNRGQNYRVHVEKDGSALNQGTGSRYHPIPTPKYRSYFGPSNLACSVHNSADLQHVQRSLSSRIKPEWLVLVK